MADNATKRPDTAEAEAAIRVLLQWLGEDPDRAGLRRTPTRVLNCFDEWYGGYNVDPASLLGSSFPDADGFRDMVALTHIDFESHCEHHMAPFVGRAHIGYLPESRVVGVSKLVKVVDAFARRLQVQEKLTKQIAECIYTELQPKGVAVMLEAQHACMSTRGVYKNNINMVSTTLLGCFETDAELRREFHSVIAGRSASAR